MQEALVSFSGTLICSATALFLFIWAYENWDSELTNFASFSDADKIGAFTLEIVMATVDLYFVVRFVHWAWSTPLPAL